VTGVLVNICFHGVGVPQRELEPGEAAYWVSRGLFHDVLDLVADDPRVRISFDDANASDHEVGLPALLDRGLRATFFVLAGRLDSPGSLSSAQLRDLVEQGMTIGSHGMDHRPWRGLGAADLDRELVEARAILRDTAGTAVDEAALPLGRYDRRLLRRVRAQGYTRLHTSDRQWSHDRAWLQPRFSIRAGDTPDSVRREILSRATLAHRTRRTAVTTIKRLR
jgi:peptidoglycan/xylan/chitin deacetylase (PgdA/CDA1 family)